MNLVALAVLSKENEPLYMTSDPSSNTEEEPVVEEDAFGLSSYWNRSSPRELSLEHEFLLHQSLDRLEELLGRQYAGLSRRPGATTTGTDSHWVGLISDMEGYCIYAHVTATNIKFLALCRPNAIQMSTKEQEDPIKTLLEQVHEAYVKHMLNPFSQPGTPIESKKFDQDILRAMEGLRAQEISA